MNWFSERSQEFLNECHPDLQRLFAAVLPHYDCSILEGGRSEALQNKYFKDGLSKLEYPHSKHNASPSRAVHAAPYPYPRDDGNGKERARFYHFAGFVSAIALSLGIHIRWGGDWDGDFSFRDQNFDDLLHFELKD